MLLLGKDRVNFGLLQSNNRFRDSFKGTLWRIRFLGRRFRCSLYVWSFISQLYFYVKKNHPLSHSKV